MRREVATYVRWYEEFRPHQGLEGRTPREAYNGGTSNDHVQRERALLVVRFHEGRRELPIVELKNAA